MTSFISFLLKKCPKSRSISEIPGRHTGACPGMLSSLKSCWRMIILVCLLGLGFFGFEPKHWERSGIALK